MGLADYKPEERTFDLKGGSFTVRGLSLNDFATLVQQHMPDLTAIYELSASVFKGKTELTEADISNLAIAVAEQAPGLAANIIALASGDTSEKSIKGATLLPMPVQVDALVSISSMTFDEVGGIKKAFGVVAGLLAQRKELSTGMTLSP